MEKNLILLDADYIIENNKGVVRLFCKDKSGKTVLVVDPEFEPYFYIQPKDGKFAGLKKKILDFDYKIAGSVKRVENIEKNFYGEKVKLLQLILDNPRNVTHIKDVVKEWTEVEKKYEFAESFPHRYILDKNLEPMAWLTVEGKKIKSDFNVDEVIEVEK